MQRKHLGKAMRYLVAVCALVSALAILACGGDDEEGEVKNVVATVPADEDTIAAVQGRTFTIESGQVFGELVVANQIKLIFTTPTTFSLTQQTGPSLSGTVSYDDDSCRFVTTSGGALEVETCNLIVNADNVVVGTGQVSGTISLVLSNDAGITINSDALPATAFIDKDGELFVVNPVTGVSVDMGIEP